ncbi:hypothetical protein C2E20_7401 [Micractinium conductrix]|uniref:Uncharacterized protein n=1 Tax=Micractinium conductrix TaxID=554055 RepID=A0A2P6V4I7_9CHLO|nr:hypothetical protein C2E20_7401 [Micractinium conductrix]|eukprot:PSC69005.1 hypothetical protein C2E20_7401 [Micractinium conductrix]
MPGLAGTAYDGSVWVTAVSSVGLVVASAGFVAAGAALVARRVASGAITFGGEEGTVQTRGGQAARRVQPLSKSSAQERQGVQPPARADAVDEVQ